MCIRDSGKTKIVPKTRNLPLEARRSTQIIFQDPLASLSPRRTAFNQIAEPLKIHNYGSKLQIQERVEWLVEKVGLTKKQLERYPHEFSGGQGRGFVSLGQLLSTLKYLLQMSLFRH